MFLFISTGNEILLKLKIPVKHVFHLLVTISFFFNS